MSSQLHQTALLCSLLALGVGGASGCDSEPMPLPTEQQAAEADAEMAAAEHPPLTQLLYDQAQLPAFQKRQQRVRLLIWIRHMELGAFQLKALSELTELVRQERARIEGEQRRIAQDYDAAITPVYDQLWESLRQGKTLDDPALEAAAAPLLTAKKEHERSDALLALRVEGIRTILEAERPWLATLTPKQEALLSDSLFALRNVLDPYANPGDFRALIGTVFSAGDYGTLTRGSYTEDDLQLDLSRLWSDYSKEQVSGPVFSDARRELLLYMLLQEPALPEAIAAALGEEYRAEGLPEPEEAPDEAPEGE
ncbi:MAG: hypothetical protein H6741_01100 [Alphaproteobacteria bacterium]|nr:hypothetical protein [Alphaproteobacteria bacterium]MCB9791296.1 hypothetical protein [Alphaproteobacteria bacterium]